MSDIELIIKIPEETVNEIKDNAMFVGSISSDIRWDVTNAIVNSVPLPREHGRLIDADKLWDSYHNLDYDFYEALDQADAIIESDNESEG